jgi:hypothetical protein
MKNSLLLLLALTSAAILAGCGQNQPDFFVLVDDVRGVKPKTEVVWRGTRVGQVSKVFFESGRFHIAVRLDSQYQNQIRSDATVKITNGITSGFRPVVRIEGGQDAAVFLIKPGAQLVESHGLVDTNQVRQWLSSTLPEMRDKLDELCRSANSPEAQKLRQSFRADIEKIRQAIERGDATIAELQRRLSKALDAALNEISRENNDTDSQNKKRPESP